MVHETDALARAAIDGDRESLDRFVRLIQTDVWRFCAHLTRPDEAEDLAQEALLRIVTYLPRWERGPVMTWVLGVARNVCREHLRKSLGRRTDPVAEPRTGPAPDAHSAVETVQMMAKLPYDQREAIVLTQLIGLPYAEAQRSSAVPSARSVPESPAAETVSPRRSRRRDIGHTADAPTAPGPVGGVSAASMATSAAGTGNSDTGPPAN